MESLPEEKIGDAHCRGERPGRQLEVQRGVGCTRRAMLSAPRRRRLDSAIRAVATTVITCGGIGPMIAGPFVGRRYWGTGGLAAGTFLGIVAGLLTAVVLGAASEAVITRFWRWYGRDPGNYLPN